MIQEEEADKEEQEDGWHHLCIAHSEEGEMAIAAQGELQKSHQKSAAFRPVCTRKAPRRPDGRERAGEPPCGGRRKQTVRRKRGPPMLSRVGEPDMN